MSENTSQIEGELFVTDDSEQSPETGSTTLNLDSGEETKGGNNPAASQRAKQVATWQARIDSGEVSIDDIPVKQQWIRDAIEGKQPKVAPLDEDLLEQKLVEREQRKAFDSQMAELNSLPLTAEQKKAIESEYKELARGAKDIKALKTAIRLANLPDFTAEQRRLGNARMPVAGMSSESADTDDIENMSEEERLADSERLRRRGGGPPRI